jgi:hypothetical protein
MRSRYEKNNSHFDGQQLDLAGVTPADPGDWTFRAEGSKEISYVAHVRANWYENRTVDYSE